MWERVELVYLNKYIEWKDGIKNKIDKTSVLLEGEHGKEMIVAMCKRQQDDQRILQCLSN